MKTNNVGLTILAHQPEKTPTDREDIQILIRTEDGNLMTNRVRSLLKEYGDRVQIPASLVLEILNDRNRKSRGLKAARAELIEYDAFAGEALKALVELHNASALLLWKLLNTAGISNLESLTEEIEEANAALDFARDFIAECTEEEFDNGDDDDDDDDYCDDEE